MSMRPWFPPRGRPSPHFSWAEVVARSGYTRVPLGPMLLRNGILLTPRTNARKQAAKMEVIRQRVNEHRVARGLSPTGLHVLSWARSWDHNIAVGGARDSQHLYFRACDVAVTEIDRMLPWQGGRLDFDQIVEDVFSQGGVGEYPSGNRHMDCRGWRARWTSFVSATGRLMGDYLESAHKD